MTPRRVLHIVGSMNRAGAETMIMNLYREMDRSRYQFDFVYFGEKPCDYDDEIEQLGGRVFRLPAQNLFGRFLKLFRLLSKGEWRIVHSHTLFSSGLHLLAAKLARVPQRIAHAHNTNDTIPESMAGWIYKRTMANLLAWCPTDLIACGKAASKHLFPGRSDITILPNAIDIDAFVEARASGTRGPVAADRAALTILQVGRLIEVKNHSFSIRIAQDLKRQGVDFRMFFVGHGPQRDTIDALIRDNGLQDQVVQLGMSKNVAELMAAADVMLMPSLYEGFPVVLVESQAAGLPSVISSTISDEVDLGLGLVRFMDLSAPTEAWASQILVAAKREIIESGRRREALAARGFSARRSAIALSEVYREK